jgi:hypothetical protein
VLAEEETPPSVVFLKHRVGAENIEIELEKVTGACCALTVCVRNAEQEEVYREFSVSLYDATRELVASRVAREGNVTFQSLAPGTYTLQIEEAETVLVEIALNLETE